MGMYLTGAAPASPTGEHYESSIGWWAPLVGFIKEQAPEIHARCPAWHLNDGQGLGPEDAEELAQALRAGIAAGTATAYGDRLGAWTRWTPEEQEQLAASGESRGPGYWRSPDDMCFSLNRLSKFAVFCENSNGFSIY